MYKKPQLEDLLLRLEASIPVPSSPCSLRPLRPSLFGSPKSHTPTCELQISLGQAVSITQLVMSQGRIQCLGVTDGTEPVDEWVSTVATEEPEHVQVLSLLVFPAVVWKLRQRGPL